jgi:hypothetical protein
MLASQINAAIIQLAKVRLMTSKRKDARLLASSVVRYYRRRGAETHVMCQEAELVWAEATISQDNLDLIAEQWPGTSQWGTAELALRDLYESYRASAGPESMLTLKAGVQYALVLVRLDRQSRSRAVLSEVLPALEKRFGGQHPLWLRAQYVLGVAHLHLGEFDAARRTLEGTWHGQRTALGPHHYETLRTQLDLSIALKCHDQQNQQRERELVTDVRRHLPAEVGRGNELYERAFLAEKLLLMPGWVARTLFRSARLASKHWPFQAREETDG